MGTHLEAQLPVEVAWLHTHYLPQRQPLLSVLHRRSAWSLFFPIRVQHTRGSTGLASAQNSKGHWGSVLGLKCSRVQRVAHYPYTWGNGCHGFQETGTEPTDAGENRNDQATASSRGAVFSRHDRSANRDKATGQHQDNFPGLACCTSVVGQRPLPPT